MQKSGRRRDLTGVVLAGGRSLGIGRDKALLTVAGRTFVERALASVRQHAAQVVVVGSASNALALRSAGADSVLVDLEPGRGPLMGVYTALRSIHTSWSLIVPCDMVWEDETLIGRLLAGAADGDAAAFSSPGRGMQPFPLLCRRSAAGSIGVMLQSGQRSMKSLSQHLRVDVVRPEVHESSWRAKDLPRRS